MRLTKNLGMLLLGIWLALQGLEGLVGLSFRGLGTIEAILALVAGILIMVGRELAAGSELRGRGPHAAPKGEALRGQYSAIRSATGSPMPTSCERMDIQGGSSRPATIITREASTARRAACQPRGVRLSITTPAARSSALATTPSTIENSCVPEIVCFAAATHSSATFRMPI